MRSGLLVLVALAGCVLLFALPARAATGSRSFSFSLSGGLPFCTQCGSTSQYACSSGVGAWRSSFSILDPVPTGSMVSSVSVTILGSYACNYVNNVIEADINAVPIDILESGSSNACACNTCDGTVTYASSYAPFGLPNYVYGGNNNVSLNIMSGQICLSNVNITVSWTSPTYDGTKTAIQRWNVARYSSPKVCNTFGYDSSSSISLNFQDPLPAGSILLLANVQVFGSFWCYSSGSVAPTITATLIGTSVGSVKLPSRSFSSTCNVEYNCAQGVWTSGSPMYQTGWPNYKYGNTNTLRLDTSYYPRIGQVALYLTYYSAGDLYTMQMPLGEE